VCPFLSLVCGMVIPPIPLSRSLWMRPLPLQTRSLAVEEEKGR
jgi:hypothetical protein